MKLIFASALECDPGEREGFLASACGDDAELRSEVASLLESDSAAGDFIEQPPADLSRLLSQEDPSTVVEIGRRVGAYELIRELGSGGMGTVYLARRADAEFRKDVAIKLIRKGMESDLVIERFREERQILASLEHANIARLMDAGATSDGQPYLVMEYVEGQPIDQFCRAHQLGVRERVALFREVCAAVQYAHRNLVVHRDLKPSNVLVTAEGQVKLLDFGIAKLLRDEQDASGSSIRTWMPLMTPEYASPEQIRAEGVTTVSDVYSLGIILYQLLTGRYPFELKSRLPWDIERIICHEDPPKPSAVIVHNGCLIPLTTSGNGIASASTRKLRPRIIIRQLRGDLDNIVLKAISKEPLQRYTSAEAFNEDLRRYLEGEAVTAHPPSFRYRSTKFLKRHRNAVLAMSLLLLSLVGGIVTTYQQARRAEVERARAESNLQRANSERARADSEAATARAVNNFLRNDLLAQASASVQAQPERKPDSDLKVRTALDRAAVRIAGKFNGQPLVEAAIRQTIADTYLDLGLYSQAQEQAERALDLRRRVLGGEHPDTLASMHSVALIEWYRGDYARADTLFTKVLEVREHVLGEEHADTLSAMNDLALVNWYRGEYARAKPLFTKTLELRRRVLGQEHPSTLSTMNDLAGLYVHEGDYGGAETLFRQLVEVRQRVLGQEHPNTLLSMNNLAVVYWDEGEYSQAERLLAQVLNIKKRVLGEEHPETLSTINNLAGLYRDEGKYGQAEPLFTRVVEARRRVLGPDRPDTLISMNNLALLYLYEGRHASAELLFTKTLEARRRVLGEQHPDTLISLNNMAMLYVYEGKYAIAEPAYINVIELQRRVLGGEHPRRIASLNDLGELYLKQRKYAAAEPFLREALNSQEKDNRHTWVRYNSESLLGISLAGQEKYAEAEPLLLSGYKGLLKRKATIPWERQSALKNRAEWILTLYENWGKPDKVAIWQEQLQFPNPALASRAHPR